MHLCSWSHRFGHVVELPDSLVLVVVFQVVCRVSRGLGRIALLVPDVTVDEMLGLRRGFNGGLNGIRSSIGSLLYWGLGTLKMVDWMMMADRGRRGWGPF